MLCRWLLQVMRVSFSYPFLVNRHRLVLVEDAYRDLVSPFSRFLYDLEKVLVNIVFAHVCGYPSIVSSAFYVIGSWHRSLRRWIDSVLSTIPFFRVDVVVCWTWLQCVY